MRRKCYKVPRVICIEYTWPDGRVFSKMLGVAFTYSDRQNLISTYGYEAAWQNQSFKKEIKVEPIIPKTSH